MKPLNPRLHDALIRVFGKVRVVNEGEPFIATRGRSALKSAKHKSLNIKSSGEYYAVCCPGCGDTRFRLYINHKFDSFESGVPLSYLMVCYNEHCESDPEFRRTIRERIGSSTSLRLPSTAEITTSVPKEMALPGTCVSLASLSGRSPIIRYLRDTRKFDITELSEVWDFRWCTESAILSPNYRLIIPIYDVDDGTQKLVGWQARWFNYRDQSDIPPIKGIPKYLTGTGTKKSRILYNGYRARNSSAVVVCEGVFDAIRVGVEFGVCCFGKSVSDRQKELLWLHWGSKGLPIILGLDPDAKEETAKLMAELSTWKNIKQLDLEEGKDIGATERGELWQKIIGLLS